MTHRPALAVVPEPYIDQNPTGLIRCSDAVLEEEVPGLGDHSDIDHLEVGELAPPEDAPLLTLLAYVVRSRWASRRGPLARLWERALQYLSRQFFPDLAPPRTPSAIQAPASQDVIEGLAGEELKRVATISGLTVDEPKSAFEAKQPPSPPPPPPPPLSWRKD